MSHPPPDRAAWSLDRPVGGLLPWTAETAAWLGLLAVCFVSRVVDLGARAMGHDESLHAYYAYRLFDVGAYRHDPAYHGPLLFHLNALVYWLVGATDTTARLLPALCGVAVVGLLYAFRPWLGSAGAWLAGALLTLSPTYLFYSRYLRNDVYIAMLSLVWVYAAFRYLADGRHRWLLLVTAAMALSILAKEVAFIFGFIVGAYFAGLFVWRRLRAVERRGASRSGDLAVLLLTLALPFAAPVAYRVLGWAPADYGSAPGMARAGVVVPALLGLSVLLASSWLGRRLRDAATRSAWAGAMALFWGLHCLLFTTFFTNPAGLVSGVVGSLGYWLGQHAVARGGQPWFYYALLAGLYEFLPVALAVCAVVALLRRRGRPPARPSPVAGAELRPEWLAFVLWWAVGSWTAYTIAGEKMPWLLMHPLLPLCLLSGWWLARALRGLDGRTDGWSAVFVASATAIVVVLAVGLLQGAPFAGRDLDAVAATLRWVAGALATSVLVVALWRRTRPMDARAARSLVLIGLVGLGAVLTVRVALRLTYVNYDLATEPIVYAHGTPDIKRALAEIEQISERTTGGRDLEVAYDDASTWPLVWYLREYANSRYYGTEPSPDAMAAPVIIVGPKNEATVQPFVERGYVRRRYRLIWWPVLDYASVGLADLMRLVVDPVARQRAWRIVNHRDYPGVSLAQWPKAQLFTVHIRRDVARDVWSAGPDPALVSEATGTAAPIPELPGAPVAVHAGVYDGARLRAPTALAIGRGGRLLIADSGNDRVVVLDRAGSLRGAFGGSCTLSSGRPSGCEDRDGDGPLQLGDGQFREPWGVAGTPLGDVVVADTWNGRIQVLDGSGRFLRQWGRLQSTGSVNPAVDPLALFGPRAVAVDGDGRLLVADTGNRRLLRFDPDGRPLEQVGGPGASAGRFLEPVGIAVDPRDGAVYVADTWNRRIQRLDARLRPVAEWPVPGWESRSPLDKPYLAIDATGRLYASDPAHARVLVYEPDGRLQGALRLDGEARARPLGLAMDDATGTLFVADHANHRVVAFRPAANGRARDRFRPTFETVP